MHTLLDKLIKQYFPSSEEISPKVAAFLDELNSLLGTEFPEHSKKLAGMENFEIRSRMAKSANTIIHKLTTLDNSSQVIEQFTSLVQQQYGFSRAQYFNFNKAANNLRLSAIAGENSNIPKAQYSVLPINLGAAGKAAANQKTILASNMDLNLPDYPQMLDENIQSQAALPVILESDLLGILDVQSQTDNEIDPDLILILENLCLQTAIILNSLKFKNEMLEQLSELSSLQKMTSTEGWKTFREMSSLNKNRFIFDQNLDSAIPIETELNYGQVIQKPLQIRGEVIGSLGISSDPEQPLSDAEKNLLESISSEVSEALERARLFETSQRSASELAVLNEMGAAFAQANNEEFINENIYKYTSMLMETSQFYVSLYHEEEQELSFPFVMMDGERVTKDHPEYHQWYTRPVGTGLTGYIIENKLPILIDDNAEKTLQELGLPFLRFGEETLSWLGVPIIIGDRILGVISVQSETTPNLYNRHHLDLLTTIASQAAIAINNTRLFNQEQDRAKQERTVRTITDKVRRGADTQNMMQIALEELSQVLNADVSSIQLGSKDQLIKEQEKWQQNPAKTQKGNEHS